MAVTANSFVKNYRYISLATLLLTGGYFVVGKKPGNVNSCVGQVENNGGASKMANLHWALYTSACLRLGLTAG